MPSKADNEAMVDAVKRRDLAKCERLIDEDDALKDACSKDGATALMLAIVEGHLDIARMLVARKADIQAQDKHGQTALIHASWYGHLDMAAMLVDLGADMDAEIEDPDGGTTSLMNAIYKGHLGIAAMLIDRGANVNFKGDCGHTPLIHASWYGHMGIAAMLIDRGADVDMLPNVKDHDGGTALWFASHGGHFGIAAMLIDHGADVDLQDDFDATALMEAIYKGHLDIAKMLIDHGAAVDFGGFKEEYTALMWASFKGQLDIAIMLVDRGAIVDARDCDGETALVKACERGHLDISAMLESKSAERDALISSPDIASIVWASLIAVPPPPSPLSSSSLSPSIPTLAPGPPSPFQLCPWPRFASFYLPPAAAEAVHARVMGARTDAAACIALLCTRRVRRMTRAGALWPIRDTLRDFLVHPEAKRRLMRELEPIFQAKEELLELEGKYLGSKFAKVVIHGGGIEEKEVLKFWRVEKIFWCEKSVPQPSWCAECVGLDGEGEVPKTTAGGVFEKATFVLAEMDADIERFGLTLSPLLAAGGGGGVTDQSGVEG